MKSEEFFRAVDEDLQRDRMIALWKRFGSYIIALAILLVLGTAAWVGWQAWQERRMAAEAQRYAEAVAGLASDPAATAAKLDAFAKDADTGYRALARLREAQARAEAKDQAGAVAALDTLAGNNQADPLLRDLAALLAVARELDTGDPAALKARLEPLAAPGAPYRFSARELQAMLALRTGDAAGARKTLEDLSKEAGLPEQQARRIGQLLTSLGSGTAAS